MSDCTFAMSDCISQMLETHFGKELYEHKKMTAARFYLYKGVSGLKSLDYDNTRFPLYHWYHYKVGDLQ